MELLNKLPKWMRNDGDGDGAPTGTTPTTSSSPPPVTGITPGSPLQVTPAYGTPPSDQVLTDKIISMVTETVPDIKTLLSEAELIKSMEPDFGKRLGLVMVLKKFSPAQASDAVLALTRALEGIRSRSEGEIANARAEQVERPLQRVAELGAQKQQLLDQIAGIDREIQSSNERASQAGARLQTEQTKLNGSITQAKAWIDSLARQLTRS